MKLSKVLNNNVLIVKDDVGRECVVFGRGIAFGLHVGEKLPRDKIERVFVSSEEKNYLQQLVDTIPQKYFEISVEIIEYIETNLNTKLSNSIYVALTDHIAFIKERLDEGIIPRNSLKWEIKRYYPKEYNLSKKVVELLEEELACELNDDEIASIALHIVNAKTDMNSLHRSIDVVQLVDQILHIIRYQTKTEIDDEDIHYQRLVTHIKFFVQRVLQNDSITEQNPLFEVVTKNYPVAYKIAEKVKQFVERKLLTTINSDETTYLIIHIQKIIKSK